MASLLVFPSILEGFGWPIIEAMACGLRVATMDAPPMTEVGGQAAYNLPQMKFEGWARQCAQRVATILEEPEQLVNQRIEAGLARASKCDGQRTIDSYLEIYQQALQLELWGTKR